MRWSRTLGGALPRPEKARVVGLEARAYRGVRSGESVLDLYAIPTTRGVLTLVCSARTGAPEAPTWCLNGLDSITVSGAQPLKPAADTAYRMRAPAVLKKLDTARVSERKALRRAKGPVGPAARRHAALPRVPGRRRGAGAAGAGQVGRRSVS